MRAQSDVQQDPLVGCRASLHVHMQVLDKSCSKSVHVWRFSMTTLFILATFVKGIRHDVAY